MRLIRSSILLVLAVAVLGSLGASRAAGQWAYKLPPADSPHWWTLTDDITPEQLRQEYTTEKSIERYRRAIALDDEGRLRTFTELEVSGLVFYVDGRLHPELIRLAESLYELCWTRRQTPWIFEDGLAAAGLLEEEVELVHEGCAQRDKELLFASREWRSRMERDWSWDKVKQARKHFGELEFRTLLQERNLRPLAVLTGASEEGIRLWMDALAYHLRADHDQALASYLKEALQPHTWARLREYLFYEVAPGVVGCRVEFGLLRPEL